MYDNLLLIDGFWATGKSVLRGLLDGHSDIFMSPIQDALVGNMADYSYMDKMLEHRDLIALRKLLGNSHTYYRIEDSSLRNRLLFERACDDRIYLPFKFDFYRFERMWVHELVNESTWSAEKICSAIYANFAKEWGEYPWSKGNIKYFATMDDGHINTLNFLSQMFENWKCIYIKRDIIDTLAAYSHRKMVPNLAFTEGQDSRFTVDYLIDQKWPERIARHQHNAEMIMAKRPDRIKIIDFNQMISAAPTAMKDIADFLDIPYNESFNRFTHCGANVEMPSGKSFLGEVADTSSLFTNEELQKLTDHISLLRAGIKDEVTKGKAKKTIDWKQKSALARLFYKLYLKCDAL